MPRSMGDPGYVYRPHGEERRAAQRRAALARLGVPEGRCVVFGVLFPVRDRARVWGLAKQLEGVHGREGAIRELRALQEAWFAEIREWRRG